jgi:hypothetical protein
MLMFGCARRVGCLVVLAVVALAAWIGRDLWLPRVTGRAPDAGVRWERVTDDGATHGRAAVESLGGKSGRAYATLTAGDVAALFLAQAKDRLPPSITGLQAAVHGDRLMLRGSVDIGDLKALDALGPMAAMISGRQNVSFTGTVDVVKSGLAQFRVVEAKVGELSVPSQAIPRLITQLDRGARPAGVVPNGIPFPLPPRVGDVRVSNGRITLYKTVP